MSEIYTIGYEGSDIERFIETLVILKIEAVADVRELPISRKKGFSKNKLRESLARRNGTNPLGTMKTDGAGNYSLRIKTTEIGIGDFIVVISSSGGFSTPPTQIPFP